MIHMKRQEMQKADKMTLNLPLLFLTGHYHNPDFFSDSPGMSYTTHDSKASGKSELL